MKNFLLTMAVALAAAVSAGAAGPVYFTADFANPDAWPAGWTTKGSGAELMDAIKDIWGDSGAYKVLDFPGKGSFACSTSNFSDGSIQANEWLISPKIHIDDDNAVLCYTVTATNIANIGLSSNSYKVKISTDGPEPDKFQAESLASYSINGATREMVILLKGYQGKDVNIAFVNDSKQPGVLGFGNIYVGSYYVQVKNNSVEYITPTTVKLSATLRTPVASAGFNARLIANGEVVSKVSINTQLYGQYNTFNVSFPERLEVDENTEIQPYTVEITPAYKDAPTYTLESSVKRSVNYPTKVVLEECTGTWCQFCPRGAVTLDYYTAKYPDTFLGIAVHGSTSDAVDPMAFGSPSQYILPLGGDQGFPMGRINRDMSFIFNFGNSTTVPAYMDEVSVNDIAIKDMTYNEATSEISLNYDARLGYAASNLTFKVVAVVTEDGVTGTTKEYDQENNYSGTDSFEITDLYGADWMPYWKKYITYPSTTIKARDMVYDHVARCLYPSFAGSVIGSEWEKDVPVSGSMSFMLPNTIQNLANTKVNLLMTDPNGRVVSFASKHIKENGSGDGVEAYETAPYNASVNGRNLLICAEPGATAEIYSLAGARVLARELRHSTTALDASSLSGLHIIRINGPRGSKTMKLIF